MVRTVRFNLVKSGDDAMADDADVIVVGGGLAGLVAAAEIVDAGKRAIVVDQESEPNTGGRSHRLAGAAAAGGGALVSGRGLGRARRLRGRGPRQFRAAFPPHLGYGAGLDRPLR